MNILFKKTILVALVSALAISALPLTNVFAADENPPVSNDRLEKAWSREQNIYQRLGKIFENTDDHIAKLQGLLDKAASNGKDISALQAALDAFSSALNSARPTYDSMQPIMDSHAGFDANGKVTDAEQARTTVQDMRAKLQELKSAMNGTGKALRDAIRAFRQANHPNPQSSGERDN